MTFISFPSSALNHVIEFTSGGKRHGTFNLVIYMYILYIHYIYTYIILFVLLLFNMECSITLKERTICKKVSYEKPSH